MKMNGKITTFISTMFLAVLLTVLNSDITIASDNMYISHPANTKLGPVKEPGIEVHSRWVDSDEMQAAYATDSNEDYSRLSEFEAAIQNAVINREETLVLNLDAVDLKGVTADTIVEHAKKIMNDAVKHIACEDEKSNSKLGDYYDKTRGRNNINVSYSYNSTGLVSAVYTYTFTYYTDKTQEHYVDEYLKDIVYKKLQLSDKKLTDAQKICEIYNWIIDNVSYDYENLNDDSNLTKYTAYGALHDKKAVCQGFAVLFYRMCMDNGIDCRIITGTANGGGHAWNIAKVDGEYYYLDSTWDCKVIADGTRSEKAGTYFYFLRSSLPDHTEYTSDKITDAYPMSDNSISAIDAQVDTQGKTYLSSQDVILKDICGNTLSNDKKKWFKVTVSAGTTSCEWNLKVGSNAIGMEDLIFVQKTLYTHNDSDKDGKCDVCNQFMDGVGARLAGYSLSLSGDIGVKFYMELSDEIKKDKDAYMNFTLPDNTTTKVYVNDFLAEVSSKDSDSKDVLYAATKEINGVTYYVFTCNVAAKEMTADIKAQIVAGDKKGEVYTYSVKDYADYILSHAADDDNTDGYDEKTISLVKAMLNYGGYTQQYFEYKLERLANSDLTQEEKAEINTVDADKFTNDMKITGDNNICTFESAYLSLKTKTDICVYVKMANGVNLSDVTFKVDDEIINAKQVGESDRYVLTVNKIAAHKLADMHTFTVLVNNGDSVDTSTLSYGAFSYCQTALSDKFNDLSNIARLRDVLKALYLYNQAAITYMN